MISKSQLFEILRNPVGSLKESGRLARLLRNNLSVFVVNSGNWAKFPELTLNSANEFPNQLFSLIELEESHLVDFNKVFPKTKNSQKLGSLFEFHGSDKSSHGYERIYTEILDSLPPEMNIELLEIGIGTNSPGLVSTMGKNAKPGASLRAFVEFDSRINVIGADIDRKILFSSDRINCFYIDQKNLESYYELSKFSRISKFDLIIDDGLHSTFANMNSLIFAQTHLTCGGILIIEDIPDRAIPLWNLVVAILREKGHDLFLTRAMKCNVLVFKKLVD
jgi:hypothetical protein